jgi:hypothetical protein
MNGTITESPSAPSTINHQPSTTAWPARTVLFSLVGYKVLYLSIIFLALRFSPHLNREYYRSRIHWPRGKGPTLATHLATWDGAHYLYLSEVGYKRGSPSCAFYPLWPMLIRGFSWLTARNHLIAGLVLANLLSIVGVAMFHRFVTLYHGLQTANLSTVLLLALPGALFFSFIYTESLFFFLIVLFFWFLFKDNFLAAGVVGFFLPLTKAIGIFCILPAAAYLLFRRSADFQSAVSPISNRPARRARLGVEQTQTATSSTDGASPLPSDGRGIKGEGSSSASLDTRHPSLPASPATRHPSLLRFLMLDGPLLGYLCYFLFMRLATGNQFEGFQAQRFYPNQPSIMHVFDPRGFWEAFSGPVQFHGLTDSFIDRALFVLVLLCLLLLRLQFASSFAIENQNSKFKNHHAAYLAYALPAAIIPAMASLFFSYNRNLMMCFPVFIALADFLKVEQRFQPVAVGQRVPPAPSFFATIAKRLTFWSLAAVAATTQIWFLLRHINFSWAG